MKRSYCTREAEIMETSGKEFLPDDLSQHISGCDHCHELLEILAPMQKESARAVEEARAPSADFIWWRSRLHRRRRLATRAIRPIAVMETVTPLLLACVLMFAALYINYKSEQSLLQGIGWAVITVSSLLILGCIAAYRVSVKKTIG